MNHSSIKWVSLKLPWMHRKTTKAPFKVPGIKVRGNAGVVKAAEVTQEKDEADKGYSVAYEEAEKGKRLFYEVARNA